MRNVLEKVVQRIKTHNLYSITFVSDNRSVYETMLKNIVEPGKAQMSVRRMRLACCITNATDTHSEYAYLSLSTAKMFK
jgi:hypothetical protein